MFRKIFFSGLMLFFTSLPALAISPEKALAILPENCNFILQIKAKEVLQQKPLAQSVQKFLGYAKKHEPWLNPFTPLGIDPLQLEEIILAASFHKEGSNIKAKPYLILTSKQKIDLAQAQKNFKTVKAPEGMAPDLFNMTCEKREFKGINTILLKYYENDQNPICLIQLNETSVIALLRDSLEQFIAVKSAPQKSLVADGALSQKMLKNKDAFWLSYSPGTVEKESWKKHDETLDFDALKKLQLQIQLQDKGQLLKAEIFCKQADAAQDWSTLINLFAPRAMGYCRLPAENFHAVAKEASLHLKLQMKHFDIFSGYRNYQDELWREQRAAEDKALDALDKKNADKEAEEAKK